MILLLNIYLVVIVLCIIYFVDIMIQECNNYILLLFSKVLNVILLVYYMIMLIVE